MGRLFHGGDWLRGRAANIEGKAVFWWMAARGVLRSARQTGTVQADQGVDGL